MRKCDVLIVGGGPGGLAAACAAKKQGATSVIVLERDAKAGGILNQCIHDGFGLIRYGKALTGPEYADLALAEAIKSGAEILTDYHVSEIKKNDEGIFTVWAYTKSGLERFQCKAIVMATGCRERTRGNISIPGSRPAGIYTAGVAQNLINIRNVMIGKRVVILGSGDIGLIMARRLTLEGAKVLAIAEVMNEPTGLARNVSQCVYEFGIPLYVNTTVSRIIGKHKLEAVELSNLDKNGKPISSTARRINCDALVLSVGLIPENEVAQTVGVELMPNNSVNTDKGLQTNVQGVFSCGNSRHVMDLADYVSEQGEMAGRNAVHYICGNVLEQWDEEKSNCMKKGFPEEGTVTCTICPNGCQIKWNEKERVFTGNRCNRGELFAEQERKAPMRSVTTTVKVSGKKQALVSVKTAENVERDSVQYVVDQLKVKTSTGNVRIGDEICNITCDKKNIKIIATARI